MLEIRISPETPAEFEAVAQLMQKLAGMNAELGLADARANTSSAPLTDPPASTAEEAADAADIVSIEPSPPSSAPDPAYSAQQVLEALQEFARTHGAIGLTQVLDRFGARRFSELKPEQYRDLMTIVRGEDC
jgi:hypothetical protein